MKNASLLFTLLAFLLLASCQAASIPLAAPTPRPPDIAPVAAATAAPTPPPSAEPARLAGLIALQGSARWRASAAAGWDCANIGQELLLENQVLTESGAKAVIEYLDGLLVHVAPKTLFTVTKLEQAEDRSLLATLRLLAGQLFVAHEGGQASQIRVETEAGIAGVRGTMLSVKVTISGRVIVTCLEGTCTLENEYGKIVLQPGQQAEILGADLPPVFLGLIADYQLNEWFANHPDALLVALEGGLLAQLPEGCTLDNGALCQVELDCDPNTGAGCLLPAGCDPLTGLGCELAGGCNPVTGEGCELPPGCDPASGEGCTLATGCNPVSGTGCAPPLYCNLLTGLGCQPGAGCDPQSGAGCELASGCNPVTGSGCDCTGGSCAGASIPGGQSVPTDVPAAVPTLPPAPPPATPLTASPTLPSLPPTP
jgi:hypothetical protein